MEAARAPGGPGPTLVPATHPNGRPGRRTGRRTGRLPVSVTLALEVAGAGLLLASGGMHLDLYLTGYREIPTVGDLFLVQVIAAFAMALAVLALRRRLVDAAGSLLSIGTLAGYVAFRMWTIFGFREVGTEAGTTAGIIEIAAFVVLATSALLGSARSATR